MISKNELLELLDRLSYNYKIFEHEAFFSVDDSEKKRGFSEGAHTKNLFLKNKKNNFFLLSCEENKKIDLKKVSKVLKLGNLSFANKELLLDLLGIYPGSVTPFGLLNNQENNVSFYLDKDLMNYKTINFHPLVNTSTINMDINNFINFLIENGKKVNIFDFNNYSLIT